jgi:hypothetical protein
MNQIDPELLKVLKEISSSFELFLVLFFFFLIGKDCAGKK